MKPVWVALALVGCHHETHDSAPPSCSAKLAELATFYQAVAADNALTNVYERAREAQMTARVETVPEIDRGAPADLAKPDLLVIGPTESKAVKGDGSALVLLIDGATPGSRVDDELHELARNHPDTIAVAYSVKGARTGRAIPAAPGAEKDHVDISGIGAAVAKTTAEHCPAYAKQLASLQEGNVRMTDAAFLRDLAATLPGCECGVDTTLLEVVPWLYAKPLVTTVPLAATAPPIARDQTWGQIVAAAKGPVPLALPALPPPPPPPPPPPRKH